MAKPDTKKPPTFAALIAESEPDQSEVTLGKTTIWVRELSGRERFEAGEKADVINSWELMLWVCEKGIVSPRPGSVEELEQIKPEWVKEIAQAIMELSGMTFEAKDDAEKGSAEVIDIGGS